MTNVFVMFCHTYDHSFSNTYDRRQRGSSVDSIYLKSLWLHLFKKCSADTMYVYLFLFYLCIWWLNPLTLVLLLWYLSIDLHVCMSQHMSVVFISIFNFLHVKDYTFIARCMVYWWYTVVILFTLFGRCIVRFFKSFLQLYHICHSFWSSIFLPMSHVM